MKTVDRIIDISKLSYKSQNFSNEFRTILIGFGVCKQKTDKKAKQFKIGLNETESSKLAGCLKCFLIVMLFLNCHVIVTFFVVNLVESCCSLTILCLALLSRHV